MSQMAVANMLDDPQRSYAYDYHGSNMDINHGNGIENGRNTRQPPFQATRANTYHNTPSAIKPQIVHQHPRPVERAATLTTTTTTQRRLMTLGLLHFLRLGIIDLLLWQTSQLPIRLPLLVGIHYPILRIRGVLNIRRSALPILLHPTSIQATSIIRLFRCDHGRRRLMMFRVSSPRLAVNPHRDR